MPIYEYQCGSCKELHEVIQKVSDALLTECPACGAQALKKQITAGAFRLSGSGWYETDFKTGDKKKNLSGDSQGSSDTGKKTDSGGESKPAASKESSTKASSGDSK